MAAIDASLIVQKAVYDALTAALAPVPVYDMAPQTATYPHVELIIATEPDETKTDFGQAHVIELHVWSRARGQKEVKEIIAAIYTALNGVTLTVPGFAVTRTVFEGSRVFTDIDGLTLHGMTEFRLTTS